MSTLTASARHEAANDTETWKYAEKSLNWYGWGSPIGLSVFLVSLGLVLLLIHEAGLLR